MLCEVVDVWCGVWAAQCAVCDRNARHGMSWRGGNGFGDVLRQMEIYFAQYYGFLGYFECVFAMLSSNVGKSFDRAKLLLQIFNGSLTTRCWITARVFSSILHHQLSNTCHKTPRTGTLISIGIGFSSILYRYVFFGCIDGVKHLHREIHLK